MAEPNRAGHKLREDSETRMRFKELLIIGKEAGLQIFLNTGQIDFGILGVGMIAMNTDCHTGEAQQQ